MCENCNILNVATSTEMFEWINDNWEKFYLMTKDSYSQSITPIEMVNKIQADYLKYMTFDQFNKAYTSAYNNLYNYSLAKTHIFMEDLRKLSDTEILTKVPDMNKKYFYDWQNVENNQVQHTSEIYEISDEANISGQYLMYQTSEDGKVRSTHKKANGAVSKPNSKWWNDIGYALLGEFNCRCAAVPVNENEEGFAVKEPKIKTADLTTYNTEFGIDEDKLIIFKEDVGYFKDAPAIIKRRYKKIDLPL
jgi:hypothetical protein